MKGRIYKIWNDINDKLYVGKTLSSIECRFKMHIDDSKKTKVEKRPLYNAMNKYGIEHFHIELIEECDAEELSAREMYWIGYYHTYTDGYNATLGGEGRALYDYDLIVDLYNQGLTNKEIREKLHCDSDVIKRALNGANIDTHTNIYHRLEKPIQAFDKQGNLLYSFNSVTKAAKWLIEQQIAHTDSCNTVITVIGRVANGKRKTAYKMIWKWVE